MKQILSLALAAAFIGVPVLTTGCDRDVAKEESVKVKDDGTVKKDSVQVKEKADGTVVKEEKHTTDKP